ncbi:MAG: globin [Armatimonadetes bacterium]|nr:globin [Armatimonadota bacterium]
MQHRKLQGAGSRSLGSTPKQANSTTNAPLSYSFELAGGELAFHRLARRFYQGVARDETLRPMYPADLGESAHLLALFLIQFCGGPATYSQQKGHPRLRMRHLPFSIGQQERDSWVFHMNAALQSEIENAQAREFLSQYFERTATFMMNR